MANPAKTLRLKSRSKNAFRDAQKSDRELKRYGKKYSKSRNDKWREYSNNSTDAASTRYNSVYEAITAKYIK